MAKSRVRGQAQTNEGAVAAPPRLPTERPPIAFVRSETLEPSTARPKVRISLKSRAGQSSSFAAEGYREDWRGPCTRLTRTIRDA